MPIPGVQGCDVEFDPGHLGHWIFGPPLPVTGATLDRYADAVDADAGRVGAPLFSIVACYPILFAAVDAVTPVGQRERVVHGEHDVTVHRLVGDGETLVARGRPIAVSRAGAGAGVHVQLEVRDERHEMVATHLLTAVCRGAQPAQVFGTVPDPWPELDPPSAQLAVPVQVADDQPRRYAKATGDRNAVHLDDAAARSVGFDGVIAHGLGVLGLVTSALVRTVCSGDPERLKRVRVRFSAPVLPGSTLTLQVGVEKHQASWVVTDPSGTAVLRDGRAQLV